MDARVQNPTDSSIGELFGRLADDGRALVRAEVGLYKQIAVYRANKAKLGVAALVAGGLLAFAGLIALLVGFVIGLTDLVGGVAAGLIVFAVTGIIAFLLVRWGSGKMAALSGDNEERQALAAGETRL
ncbi:MAG TPA: phage holin family protein [Allosphingosinicella sp.]|uniref:phage holin family protein n=1 Tax=Allosphingosinicella sp. TaxID=2823234 RepID=UPI002EDB5BDB